MKNLIVLLTAFTLLAGLSSFAGPEECKSYTSKQFSYGLSFHKIVVENDIDLVVYENATSNIQFDGSNENIAKVEWKIKKGVLYLKSNSGSLKNKVMVTLDVTRLSGISIQGASHVRSLGHLNSPELNIYMNGDCSIAIRNTGAINIINPEEKEMNVKEQSGDISIR